MHECLNVLMLELIPECLIVLIPEWLARPNHSINQAIKQSSNQIVFDGFRVLREEGNNVLMF